MKLELVLIPAGKFIMGTPEHEKPFVGKATVGVSGCILFVAVVVLVVVARKKRKRPQFSMAFLAAARTASYRHAAKSSVSLVRGGNNEHGWCRRLLANV